MNNTWDETVRALEIFRLLAHGGRLELWKQGQVSQESMFGPGPCSKRGAGISAMSCHGPPCGCGAVYDGASIAAPQLLIRALLLDVHRSLPPTS